MNNISDAHEKIIIKRQWISVMIAFILAILGIAATMKTFGPGKYSLLAANIPFLYLAISSIRNRISIVRIRGQHAYSRGSQAVFMGILILVSIVMNVVVVFSPFLDSFSYSR